MIAGLKIPRTGILADRLSLKPGMRVLDAGCGVGGPMGALARDTGTTFVGLNNNAYQLERAKAHTRDVQSLCSFIHGDFMQIPEGDDSYDAVMAIESMPHAPDKTAAFRETFRVLRPGGCFGGFDWCLTEAFDSQDAEHLRVKTDIMRGNGSEGGDTARDYPAIASARGIRGERCGCRHIQPGTAPLLV